MGTEAPDSVSTSFLRLALRYAELRGVDAARSLRALGLKGLPDERRIEGRRFAKLLARLAELASDPLFGIRLGSWAAGQPIHHLVLATALSAATTGDVLRRLVRFHHLIADAIDPALAEEGAIAELRVDSGATVAGGRLAEAAVALLCGLVRRMGGDGAVTVTLRGPPLAPSDAYREALGAEVGFGAACDAVRFPAQVLASSNPLADPDMGAVLERHAAGRLAELRRGTWTARAGRAVREGLAATGSVPDLARVCRGLGVSARTLQLRLRAEGTGFRPLIDDVRRQRGEELLRDRTVSLVEIAFLLGFADQSAFTNAFRRWTGRPPAVYRRSISPVRR